MEQAILLPEGLDGCVGVGFFGLEGHVCVCNLRDGRAVVGMLAFLPQAIVRDRG